LKFYKGDLIFGKRRAYQRKAAVAHCDGICSAHAMVLRANSKVILPDLFPFFIHSDQFMKRAIDISVGSLSPTINWSTLKSQEFLLPPIEEQARLAELLWAGDEVVEKYQELEVELIHLRKVIFTQLAKDSADNKVLGDLGTISYGMGVPPKTTENGVPVIRATNIHMGEIFEKEMIKVNPEDISSGKRVFLDEGDIIVVRSGAYTGDVGFINSIWSGALAGYDLVIKPHRNEIDPLFLREVLISEKIQDYFKSESTRSAQPHLNAEQLKATLVPFPNLKTQVEVGHKIESLVVKRKSVESHLNACKNLQKQIINQIFSA
jgi:restriction endonuclease S subunit